MAGQSIGCTALKGLRLWTDNTAMARKTSALALWQKVENLKIMHFLCHGKEKQSNFSLVNIR